MSKQAEFEAQKADAHAIQTTIDILLDDYRTKWGHDPHMMLQKHRVGKETKNVVIVTAGKL